MKELPSLYQYFIHASRYSRWLPEEGRRESWEETVERYFRFFEEHLLENHKYKLTPELREDLKNAILNLEVMPSMRALMTAGEALKRENVAGYNCSYVAVNRLRAFDEILYVLMNGCFEKNTLIQTSSGPKKICDITPEDQVLSFDIENNKFEFVNPEWCVETLHSAEKQKIEIEFEDGSVISCTEDHEFYTTNRGWVKAKDLTEEDDIKNVNEKSSKITRKAPFESNELYWDMTIPKNHNYVLANGNVVHNTGVGFSVEREFVNKLPTIAEEFSHSDTTIVVQDSKAGWARAFKELLSLLVGGQIPRWDLSKVRAAGARLKTFGGRASGPEPLDDLFRFTIETFRKAAGRKLTSIECHDIVCKVAEIVVVGGVRRCCLDIYTVETLNRGRKQLKELEIGDKMMFNGEEITITNIFDNGIQDTVNINMEDGTFHTCTKEHRWYVFNHDTNQAEWRQTHELSEGNYSMLRPKEGNS